LEDVADDVEDASDRLSRNGVPQHEMSGCAKLRDLRAIDVAEHHVRPNGEKGLQTCERVQDALGNLYCWSALFNALGPM
jgi:hypothetical protein